MENPLKQKVNFYVSLGFVLSFGFFMALTVVQAFHKDAFLLKYVSSPIVLEYDLETY